MPFTGFADQHDIEVMTKTLDVYCREWGFSGEIERNDAAARIASLFFSGKTTTEEILDAVHAGDRPERRRGSSAA